VGFCGRYGEQKNWGLAEEIILDCHENQRIIKWIIVIGTNKSNEMILEVKKYIDRITKKIGNMNIKYFIDIENESVGELYYAMDCFILTSKWESFGRTAVEAMSRKNIVIGTDVDGLSEVISNPDYLYNSKEEACEIIKKHLNSNELIESAKEYFYLRYKNNFSSTSNLNLYDKLYQDVLKLKSK
jgi:glycosyltransferase involved in cell wall biosynthesis